MNSETDTDRPSPRISGTKKALFYLLILFFFYGFIEILSYGAHRLLFDGFSFSGLQTGRDQIISPEGTSKGATHGPNRRNWNVLHPYFGYITEGLDFSIKCEDEKNCDRRLRTYQDSEFIQSTADNVIVGVLGGSFAHGVSTTANVLQQQIQKLPRFKGKKVILYHMSAGGYKQPQQVIKLNYFLALGAQFDIVINIDGFNEVAIPGSENTPKGVNPFFPKSWYYFVDGALNDDLLSLYGERAQAKTQQKQYAALFSFPLLRYSITGNLLWKYLDKSAFRNIRNVDVALVNYKESDANKRQYVATGPDYNFVSKDDFYRDLTEHWARSSILIHSLCRQLGIEYYHFLQPNQYVAGSKPMSEHEKEIAISSRSIYGPAAKEGYPYLIERGRQLETEGVPYYDLTMLYADIEKELYVDNCCHVNMPGYAMVAQKIAVTIRDNPTATPDTP